MKLREFVKLLQETVEEWWNDRAPRLAAALAFYTIFSFAPMLVIVVGLASIFFGEEAARGELAAQFQGLVGEEGAHVLQSVLRQTTEQSYLATVVGMGALLFGATLVFAELQESLNAVWGVTIKPGKSVKMFLKRRLLSFAMILGVGFLLLVSVLSSAVLSAATKFFGAYLPVPSWLLQGVQFVISFGMATILFAVIYKMLPDVKIKWSDVWVGAGVTSLLFTLGKTLIGIYLGQTSVASAYGAAGSFVILIIWVYYSAQTFFVGAEFTQVYARKYGSQIVPDENAMRVTKVLHEAG